jgi:hypothetical protein
MVVLIDGKILKYLSLLFQSNHPDLINSKKGLEMIKKRRGFSHENTDKTKPKSPINFNSIFLF